MTILAFIDPEPGQEEAATEVATVLVDYCMETGTNLALVCDLSNALDAGVAAMGSYEARTVEGADRRMSGLIEREDELDDSYHEPRFPGDQEPMEQLAQLGALQEGNPPRRRVDELASVVFDEARRAETVIGVGTRSALWSAAIDGAGADKGVVVLPGLGPLDVPGSLIRLERRPARVERDEAETDSDPSHWDSVAASLAVGEAVAALLEYLSSPSRRPEPPWTPRTPRI